MPDLLRFSIDTYISHRNQLPMSWLPGVNIPRSHWLQWRVVQSRTIKCVAWGRTQYYKNSKALNGSRHPLHNVWYSFFHHSQVRLHCLFAQPPPVMWSRDGRLCSLIVLGGEWGKFPPCFSGNSKWRCQITLKIKHIGLDPFVALNSHWNQRNLTQLWLTF